MKATRWVSAGRLLARSFVEFHLRSEFKLWWAGLIGVIGFPAYYFVWAFIVPQVYESIALRAIGTVLCAGLLASPVIPSRWRVLYMGYAYLALLYCLPVFFTTMLLLNEGSTTWVLSLMVAILVTALVFDTLNAVLVTIAGSIAGVALYWSLDVLPHLPGGYIAALPVYAFALVAIWLLSHSERLVRHEQLKAAGVLASSIAHEMRTPLLGIALDAEQSKALLERHCLGAGPASDRTIAQVGVALDRIGVHTRSSNVVIDMLLVNLSSTHGGEFEGSVHAMAQTVRTALSRFAFRSGERERVTFAAEADFAYRGPELLMVHVVFNLLRNALRAIEENGGRGGIEIRLEPSAGWNRLVVVDTAGGIPTEMLPDLFMPFRRRRASAESIGIGLAFCRAVVEGVGGSITVHTKAGAGTRFTIWLPAIAADTPQRS